MNPRFEIEVFFDGDCPLCVREMRWLQKLDRRQRVRMVDITAPDFDATSVGRTWAELMDRIHGRLPDGTLVEGVEVFRHVYSAIGLGPLVAISRWPGITQLLDAGYRLFAKNRLRLTGRCSDRGCELHARPRHCTVEPRPIRSQQDESMVPRPD